MHRRSSREVCRRAAGKIKRQLEKIVHHNPSSAGVSSGRGSSMHSVLAPGYINSRYVWCKGPGPLCSISGVPSSMVRSSRPMSFTSHLMARAKGIHAGWQHLQEEANKPKQVAVGESLAVADENTDVELGDKEEQKGVEDQPHPRQTLQDEVDERATTSSPEERLIHPDPNREHKPLVDEEVRQGLIADSQVPYGHDREAR